VTPNWSFLILDQSLRSAGVDSLRSLMALCFVLELLLCLRGMSAPFRPAFGRSPICIPQKAAERKWGKENFNFGSNFDIHKYSKFTFPKFRARRHLAKDGKGQLREHLAQHELKHPSTCLPASDILPRRPSTRAREHRE
jgi:hypothetical protein